MSELTWRKSSRTDRTNCVEVALASDGALVRDTKNRTGGHFAVSTQQWQSFLTDLKTGHYDA